jgi:predicted transcriptional regulator
MSRIRHLANNAAFAQQLPLTDNVIDRFRPHFIRKRLVVYLHFTLILLSFYLCYDHSTKMMKNNDFTLAVANLAAAAVKSNPKLSIEEAVRQATESLRLTEVVQLSAKQVADSVKPDAIVCFEDGTRHTMLRRYIKRKFNMTPEQYRNKWGLPDDYPFVAPEYSKKRARIAKKSGLGKK